MPIYPDKPEICPHRPWYIFHLSYLKLRLMRVKDITRRTVKHEIFAFLLILVLVPFFPMYCTHPCTVRTPIFNLKEPENGYTYV